MIIRWLYMNFLSLPEWQKPAKLCNNLVFQISVIYLFDGFMDNKRWVHFVQDKLNVSFLGNKKP